MDGKPRTTIRCYISPAGNNKIAEWYADLSVQERADADAFIATMRCKLKWEGPDYRIRLKGYKGLGELRWYSCNKQHRLIGFFMGGVWYAVMGCTHKQQIYKPADALDTADKRRKEVGNGKARTEPYAF